MLHLDRQRPEAVDHLGAEAVDVVYFGDVAQPPVERAEPQMQVWNIVLGDHHRRADGDLRRPAGVDDLVLTAHLGNGLFEHVLVELETDFLDMTRLLLAEQVARPADVEIMARELEARAQRIE